LGRLRVLVAEDHQLMREAIRLSLADADDIEIVGEARLGSEVLPLVQRTQPDLVLLDIRMPAVDGLTCLTQIRQRFPRVMVVILSAMDEPNVIHTALERGARAYILKHIDPRDLYSALRQSVQGTVYQMLGSPSARATNAARETGLSDKEREVLRALVKGLSNKQIARELWLAEQTVKFHLANIYRKLGVANRTEATRYAIHHCLVESVADGALAS
jgi:two-component system, NarL family, response regulator LiaR